MINQVYTGANSSKMAAVNNTWRFKLRIKVKRTASSVEAQSNFHTAFSDVIGNVLTSSPNCTLLPWWSNELQCHKGISDFAQLQAYPTLKSLRATYMKDGWAAPGQSEVWCCIRLGFNDTVENFQSHLHHLAKCNKFAVFPNIIQAEKSIVIGYLQYSHRTLDCKALSKKLSMTVGFPVAARSRNIIGTTKIDKHAKKVFAIHLEVSSQLPKSKHLKLFDLFPPTDRPATSFQPTNQRMVLIPISLAMMYPSIAPHLRDRQANFESKITTVPLQSFFFPLPSKSNYHKAVTALKKVATLAKAPNSSGPLLMSIDEDECQELFFVTYQLKFESTVQRFLSSAHCFLCEFIDPDNPTAVPSAPGSSASTSIASPGDAGWDP